MSQIKQKLESPGQLGIVSGFLVVGFLNYLLADRFIDSKDYEAMPIIFAILLSLSCLLLGVAIFDLFILERRRCDRIECTLCRYDLSYKLKENSITSRSLSYPFGCPECGYLIKGRMDLISRREWRYVWVFPALALCLLIDISLFFEYAKV